MLVDKDRLNKAVKEGASSAAQYFSAVADIFSGPVALFIFKVAIWSLVSATLTTN